MRDDSKANRKALELTLARQGNTQQMPSFANSMFSGGPQMPQMYPYMSQQMGPQMFQMPPPQIMMPQYPPQDQRMAMRRQILAEIEDEVQGRKTRHSQKVGTSGNSQEDFHDLREYQRRVRCLNREMRRPEHDRTRSAPAKTQQTEPQRPQSQGEPPNRQRSNPRDSGSQVSTTNVNVTQNFYESSSASSNGSVPAGRNRVLDRVTKYFASAKAALVDHIKTSCEDNSHVDRILR